MRRNRKRIVLVLGSNYHQKENIAKAKALLQDTFEGMVFGSYLWTDPIGMQSDKFMNLIGAGYTYVNRERTEMALKNIEHKCGRSTAQSRLGIVAVDIDLLIFDTERFHQQDWDRPYIKQLLSQVGLD